MGKAAKQIKKGKRDQALAAGFYSAEKKQPPENADATATRISKARPQHLDPLKTGEVAQDLATAGAPKWLRSAASRSDGLDSGDFASPAGEGW